MSNDVVKPLVSQVAEAKTRRKSSMFSGSFASVVSTLEAVKKFGKMRTSFSCEPDLTPKPGESKIAQAQVADAEPTYEYVTTSYVTSCFITSHINEHLHIPVTCTHHVVSHCPL